jgi:hypothetical protein
MAAVVVMLVGSATIPATAEPAISCGYRFFAWPGGFSADLGIANAGPAINGWTVRMVFPTPATLLGSWQATIVQSSPFEMIATNPRWDEVISTGQLRTFGWTATAVEAGPPAELSVNGTTC